MKPTLAKFLFCIAVSKAHADEIISRLEESGFAAGDISLLFPCEASGRGLACQVIPDSCRNRQGGRIHITGTLTVPEVGLIGAAGDVGALICMAAVRTEPGGISGALNGLGVGEEAAERLERKIHAGNILISVNSKDREAAGRARQILEETCAEDLATSGEATTPARQPEERDMYAHHE